MEHVASFPTADVVIGGPPCQGFSPLNRESSDSSDAGYGVSIYAR